MNDRDILFTEHRRYENLLFARELARYLGLKDHWSLEPRVPAGMPGGGQWVRIVHDILQGAEDVVDKPTPGFVQGAAEHRRMVIRPDLAKLRRKADVESRLRIELRRILKRDVEVDLGTRMHLTTMKEISEGILRSAEDWPEAHLDRVSARTVRKAQAGGNNVWALTEISPDGDVAIVFNTATMSNRSRMLGKLRATVANGSARPSQDNAAYFAMHEFAHALHYGSMDRERIGRMNVDAVRVLQEHADRAGVLGPDQFNDWLRGELGDYALFSVEEMIAEAFADVQINGPDARPISKDLVERLSFHHRGALNVQPGGVGRAPVPAASGPWIRYHSDIGEIGDLVRRVEEGHIQDERGFAHGAIGDTRLRRYSDGARVVYKRAARDFPGKSVKHQTDAEQLGAELARALGIDSPRIYRTSDTEVHMDFVDDAKVAAEASPGELQDAVESREGRLIGVLDLMIGNIDRHQG